VRSTYTLLLYLDGLVALMVSMRASAIHWHVSMPALVDERPGSGGMTG
jgi:hypothetical protein